MQKAADALIAATPALAADAELLVSISGVGPQTASTVLAELPPVARGPTARIAAAACCGLSPREFPRNIAFGDRLLGLGDDDAVPPAATAWLRGFLPVRGSIPDAYIHPPVGSSR